MYFLILFTTLFSLAFSAPLQPRGTNDAVTAPVGLTYYSPDFNAGATGYASRSTYTCYNGTWQKFPPPAKWQSFAKLWQFQLGNALLPIGDSKAEAAAVYTGIVQIAKVARIDARVILSMIIAESTGNVRVPCTWNGVLNCGLMQSYNPVNQTYDPKNMQNSITQMVRDGTQGTVHGPGLVQYMNSAPSTGVKTGGILWQALRSYNSGKFNATDLSNGMGATPPYVSDIANYLQGWQGWGSPNRDKCVW